MCDCTQKSGVVVNVHESRYFVRVIDFRKGGVGGGGGEREREFERERERQTDRETETERQTDRKRERERERDRDRDRKREEGGDRRVHLCFTRTVSVVCGAQYSDSISFRPPFISAASMLSTDRNDGDGLGVKG